MQRGLRKYFVIMDEYLSSLGLYRKRVAQDASSLFRAVSEQLYYSQNHHLKVRQDCANFMRENRCDFEPFVEGSFEKYLERLEDPEETAGQLEIKALSQLYRRCFLIYRYPGKPAMVISGDEFVDKVMLCRSVSDHYDIVYPKSYPSSAAVCQSILYELLYTQVFGVEEAELSQATEAFKVEGRCYGNSLSMCSDIDIGCDTPEDRSHREELESGGAAEVKTRAATDDSKPSAEAPPPSTLSLPYKVLKSLDSEVYRNVEFEVWQETCKEMQKTEYMVFSGRHYFLGDKCQVRLEPKGKYYNAFIQEFGTHPSAVTVFIEELGEKHLVPLIDLKPMDPVPAWNVAVPGDLDLDSHGQRHHRHRYFRKSQGSGGVKGAGLLITPPSSNRGPAASGLFPRFQPAGQPRLPPPLSPGAITHYSTARPLHYEASSSTRFLSRHLIGPQLTCYHPGRQYCHDYENYTFRPRRRRRRRQRQLAALSKERQFGFSVEVVERTDPEPAITYYHLDDGAGTIFPPLPGQAVPPPPTVGQEEDQEDTSTAEDQAEYTEEYLYMAPDQAYPTSGVYAAAEPPTNQDEQEGGAADSPPRPEMNYGYTQQVGKPIAVICSFPPSSSTPSSPSSRVRAAAHLPPATHTQTRTVAMAIPAPSSWLVNDLGEAICTMVPPPSYSYDPNGSDLPRDCRVLQYYFNLGVQWYHQTCWQQQQAYPATSPEAPYAYQHFTPHLSQEPPLHAEPPMYPETARGPHQSPSSYPESSRAGDGQANGHNRGPATLTLPGSSSISPIPPGPTPSSVLLYQDQTAPPSLLHPQYEPPPLAAYLPCIHPHTAHLPHHSSYHPCPPPSTHWVALPARGHTPRVNRPAPNPGHVVSYIV